MPELIPQSPLFAPVEWQGHEQFTSEDFQLVARIGFHLAHLGRRILDTHDIEALRLLLGEVVDFSSVLARQGQAESDLYGLVMCLQLRLGDKIEKKKKNARKQEYSEAAMYARFRANPSRYIAGARILSTHGTPLSRPDFFLEVNGVRSVAEFKATAFGQRHLFQLQEYMQRFQASQGFAVAPSLTCALPPDVQFVKMFAPVSRPRRANAQQATP